MIFVKLLALSIALVVVLLVLWSNRQVRRQPVLFVWPDAAGQWWWQAKVQGDVKPRNGPFDTRAEAYVAGRKAVFGNVEEIGSRFG